MRALLLIIKSFNMNSNRNFGFLSSIPTVTKNLLIINLLFWLASITIPTIIKKYFYLDIDLVNILGLHYFQSPLFNLYQFVSYMFMHASFDHLFFNMFAVFMFGRVIEQYWGSKRFLIFYLVSGIGAALVQEAVWAWSIMPVAKFAVLNNPAVFDGIITIGASGSVFGILLAFGMMFPNAPLYLMFIPIPIKAKYFVIGYGLIELFLGVANTSGDNVAHFAHLGGMLFGFLLILYWRKRG